MMIFTHLKLPTADKTKTSTNFSSQILLIHQYFHGLAEGKKPNILFKFDCFITCSHSRLPTTPQPVHERLITLCPITLLKYFGQELVPQFVLLYVVFVVMWAVIIFFHNNRATVMQQENLSQQSVLIKNDLDVQSHRQIFVQPTEIIWLVILICYSDRQ